MFPAWRYKLREAQLATVQGRLEEAGRLLSDPELRQFLPVQQQQQNVAGLLSKRAMQRGTSGEFSQAFKDLDSSELLAGQSTAWQAAHQVVIDLAFASVVKHLEASDFTGAMNRLDAIAKRKVVDGKVNTLREVVRRLESAQKMASRGKFALADEQLAAAAALRKDLPLIGKARDLYKEKGERSRILTELMHRAMAASAWSDVLVHATGLLELSPQCPLARDARKRAWAAVGEKFVDSSAGEAPSPYTKDGDLPPLQLPTTADKPKQPRMVLWIDAVGGYLVCMGEEVIIGQAGPGSAADIAIQADLSRRHARLRREGEGYVLEPLVRGVKFDGKPVQGPTLLSDGDEFELGAGVRLRFRKPHVLSASARLELVSYHRFQPLCDAVLLMAESCVLGPKWQNHVVCRDWAQDLVLYRQDGRLLCRAMESIEIDGKLCDGRGPLTTRSRVVGSDFSLSIEPIG